MAAHGARVNGVLSWTWRRGKLGVVPIHLHHHAASAAAAAAAQIAFRDAVRVARSGRFKRAATNFAAW